MPSKIKCQLNTVGLASTLMLLFLLVAIFLPITPQASRATSDLVETDAAAKLAIALDATVGIELMPSIAGEFGQSIANLTVSTNNPNGYKVYVAAAGESASLARTGGKGEITALTTTAQQSTFPSNSWGYALVEGSANGSTTYRGIPTTNQEIKSETTAGEHSYQLAFGVKLDNTLPAGEYVGDIIVSVIASPAEITNFNQLVYMQDMASSICATAAENATKRLIDVRDNKAYWVAKLRDGNCWMTQNLALDLVEGEVLTSSDTDLNSKAEWRVGEGTKTTLYPAGVSFDPAWGSDSWNLGMYVSTIPTKISGCPTMTQDNMSICNYFQKIDNSWSPTYIAKAGTWDNTTWDLVTVDVDHKQYDAHYLIGNQYGFNAALAGYADTGITSPDAAKNDPAKLVDAADSICPKGWRLPTSGRMTYDSASVLFGRPYDTEDSFYRLLYAYGYPTTDKWIKNNGNPYVLILDSTINGASQNVVKPPMQFVRGGINSMTSWWGAGLYARYWSSTLIPATSVPYTLSLDSGVLPAGGGASSEAVHVRCLTRR